MKYPEKKIPAWYTFVSGGDFVLNILEKNSTITKTLPQHQLRMQVHMLRCQVVVQDFLSYQADNLLADLSVRHFHYTKGWHIVGSIFWIQHTDGEKLGIFWNGYSLFMEPLKLPGQWHRNHQKIIFGGSLSEAYCLPIS